MSAFFRDLRLALRQLKKSPGFAASVILTLALGLGSSSALFCLMDGLWLRPVHVPQASRLARLFSTTNEDPQGSFSYSEFLTFQKAVPAFGGLAGAGGRGTLMARPDGTSQMLETNIVTANFFEVLGVRPLMGSLYAAKDAAQLRTHPGVVLDYGSWQRRFGADPAIVGKQIPLRHGKDQIIQADVWAVLPPDFRGLDPNESYDLWMPIESWSFLTGEDELAANGFRWLNLIGRLQPGATAAAASQQAAVVASALEKSDYANNHDRSARVVGDLRYRIGQAGIAGRVLFAIVLGVILLSTVNVAHLLLARGLERGREVALRLSLGATRFAVLRQMLTENLLLGALGLAAGLLLAAGLAALLPTLVQLDPAMLDQSPSALHLAIDWRVFAFAGLLALVTMALLALVPLMQIARPQLVATMQTGRTTARVSTLRRAAIWMQIGISFALLVSTAALVRSFLNTRTRPIGLTRDPVLVAFTQLPEDGMRAKAIDRLRAVPGVRQVAYGIRSPLMPSENGIAVHALLPSHPELRDPVEIKFNAVSPDFLAVTGTRLVRGRGLTQADDIADGPMSILVSHTMARKYWPSSNPLGQTVLIGGKHIEAHVVGVTEDAPISRIGELAEPFLYVPFAQYESRLSNMGEITFVLSTGPNAMTLAQPVRQALIYVNPMLDPMLVTSLPELIRSTAGEYQVMAELVTALGFIGLALTVVGLYGFLAFRVAQRSREIGIRMALGASRKATVRLVVRDTASLAAVGLGAGLALALAATYLERAVLFGVRPLDALSLLAALAVLAFAIAAAAWIPARRAASIEPMLALRNE